MIDYRRRCVAEVTVDGVTEAQMIRYGVSAGDANLDVGREVFVDYAPRDYLDPSAGGRRPGSAIEMEYPHNRHFFNQRIA